MIDLEEVGDEYSPPGNPPLVFGPMEHKDERLGGRRDDMMEGGRAGVPPTVWETLADVSSRVEADARAEAEVERRELLEGERAGISLSQRIRACRGRGVQLRLVGNDCFELVVRENSRHWILGESSRGHTLIPVDAIVSIRNLPTHAGEWEGTVISQLSLASALRDFMRRYDGVVLHTVEGTFRGEIAAVGADWIELREAGGRVVAQTVTIRSAHVRRVDALPGPRAGL